eukprot:GFUD01044602.1.p1 GENE.GFUD01044602.1~~GFUD01044602.1.p1  ORF type:complete len:401 (+),score=116.22 GFUD01044602.1:73-1203(+)
MVVVEDTALVETPDGFPVCLGCLGSLDCSSVPCPGCGWKVCSIECSKVEVHREECKIFSDKKVVPSIHYVHYFLPHGLYLVVQVLRVLLVTREVEKFGVVENLMDHWEERRKDKGVEEMVKYVGAFCRDKLGLGWAKAEDVQHAYGVLKTNAVGHVNPGGSRQCYLYPDVSLMSHSCAANMEIVGTPGRKLTFKTTRHIMKGEELTWSYFDFLAPRSFIQSKLRDIWKFDCKCQRCLDPSECGLYYSSQKCDCGGYYTVIITTKVGCNQCGNKRNMEDVEREEANFAEEISTADDEKVQKLLTKFDANKQIHSTHFLKVKLYMKLLQIDQAPPTSLATSSGSILLEVLDTLAGEGSGLYRRYQDMYRQVQDYKKLQ